MRTTQRITNVLYILALAIFISAEAIAQDGTWTTEAPIPTARLGSAAGVIAGRLYVNGGGTTAEPATTATEVYDPATNIWTAKAPSLVPRVFAGAGGIDGKLYVVGGCINSDCGATTTNILEVYDAVTDTWTIKAPMPTARSSMAVGVIAGKLHVAGGMQECGPCAALNTLEVYDPATDTWTPGASMPTARSHTSGAVIGGKLYVVGGSSIVQGSTFATLEAYDAATNTWAEKTAMPAPRANLGAGDVNGILYAVSGTLADGTSVKTVEAYDPAIDSWTAVAPIPTARYLPQPRGVNGVLYVVANGEYPTVIATNEAFTPTPVLPTTTDQCKNGGWKTYGVFKNQGDCVSFVATKGKNPPAK